MSKPSSPLIKREIQRRVLEHKNGKHQKRVAERARISSILTKARSVDATVTEVRDVAEWYIQADHIDQRWMTSLTRFKVWEMRNRQLVNAIDVLTGASDRLRQNLLRGGRVR